MKHVAMSGSFSSQSIPGISPGSGMDGVIVHVWRMANREFENLNYYTGDIYLT